MNLIILTDFDSFTVNEQKVQNYSIFKFSAKFLGIRSEIDNDQNFLILLNSSWKDFYIIFTFEFDHFEWLSQLYSEWRKITKLANLKISVRSGYAILVKIWKWLKLLNSVPFIKKALVNFVYIRIWTSWLTFTVSQWMKTNFKISQFSRFLPMS